VGAILCIETATPLCSVAVGRGPLLLAERESTGERLAHAELLNMFVDAVMREAGLRMRDLEAVAVGIGPGSYTGLRIGVSAAKGFCHALGIPIIGLGTLETLVAAAGRSGKSMWPMVDARRMEVFTQEHDGNARPVGAMAPLILDAPWAKGAGKCFVLGDGADKAAALWADHPEVEHVPGVKPHARAMLALAADRLRSGRVDDLAYLAPLYGKEANVTQPRKRSASA
jgi:tRNA threonylcarbamoyladenosine biosynthesis protein TsaB